MQGENQQPSSGATIHVVEDDESFRTSLLRVLAANGFEAKGYRCAGEFLLADPVHGPGCVLLDITMPGPSGMDLLKALHGKRTLPPVIFLTGCDDINTSVDAIKTGAVDYLVKPTNSEKLLSAINKALSLDRERRAHQQQVTDLKQRYDQLSQMERRILAGIMNNRLNKQLAAELGSCERTIKAQRARIRSKLQLRTLPDLVRASRLLEQFESEQKKPDSSNGSSKTIGVTIGKRLQHSVSRFASRSAPTL
jgi:two-component system, LuxR family, response regulator FixJ